MTKFSKKMKNTLFLGSLFPNLEERTKGRTDELAQVKSEPYGETSRSKKEIFLLPLLFDFKSLRNLQYYKTTCKFK